jgi:hypothetical protein
MLHPRDQARHERFLACSVLSRAACSAIARQVPQNLASISATFERQMKSPCASRSTIVSTQISGSSRLLFFGPQFKSESVNLPMSVAAKFLKLPAFFARFA